jgi:stearoyl-CoA desaturase (delta-9 desaturase)
MLLFCLVHLVALGGIIFGGWSWGGFALAIGVYYVRMVVVTAGYHRYFSHRAFGTSRIFQFLLAVGAQSAAQNGVLWWASHHRWHHRYSDTPLDVHSAKLRGFWYSHVGWILKDAWQTDLRQVPDLAKYPELRFLNRPGINFLPSALLGLAFLLIGGLPGLSWGYMVSTVLLWHGSFAEPLAAGHHHHRGRLAQQPPSLPERGQPGLFLVGNRPDVLGSPRLAVDGANLGSSSPARRCTRWPLGVQRAWTLAEGHFEAIVGRPR